MHLTLELNHPAYCCNLCIEDKAAVRRYFYLLQLVVDDLTRNFHSLCQMWSFRMYDNH